MEQLTGDSDEFTVMDPETRATIDDVDFVLVGDDAVVVARDTKTSYGIPGVNRVTLIDPDYVEAAGDSVVYKISGSVTITEDDGSWALLSRK